MIPAVGSRSIESYAGIRDAGARRGSSKDWPSAGNAAGLIPFRSDGRRKPRSISSCPGAQNRSGRPFGCRHHRSSGSDPPSPRRTCRSRSGSSKRWRGGRSLTGAQCRFAPSGRCRPRSTGSACQFSKDLAPVRSKQSWTPRRSSPWGKISCWPKAQSGSSLSELRVALGSCRGTGSRPASSNGSMDGGSKRLPPAGATGGANERRRGLGRAPPLARPGPAHRPE